MRILGLLTLELFVADGLNNGYVRFLHFYLGSFHKIPVPHELEHLRLKQADCVSEAAKAAEALGAQKFLVGYLSAVKVETLAAQVLR